MRRVNFLCWGRLTILAWGCALTACSGSPPTQFFTLQSVVSSPTAAPPASAAADPGPAPVRLQPVSIPPELDRLEVVTRSGAYRLRIADSERWAAPLDDQIRRVLSDDLASRLPPHWMADFDEPATDEPRRLLTIAITEFYADDACATTLRADWVLHNPAGDNQRGAEQVKRPEAASCSAAPDGIPAAMSAALGVLADRLAEIVLTQAAPVSAK